MNNLILVASLVVGLLVITAEPQPRDPVDLIALGQSTAAKRTIIMGLNFRGK